MLLPDPRLRSLLEAWSPDAMARLLNNEALPRLCPGARATDVTIASLTYRPARTCIVLYDVAIEGSAALVRLLATFGKPGQMERAFQQHYAGRDGPSPHAMLLPEHGCLIERFPADYELPSLPAALDAHAIGAALSLSAPPAVELLHYVPHRRCLLRYTADGVDVVGKLYPQGPGAPRAWALLRGLDAAQHEAGRRVTPPPVALLEQHRLVVTEHSNGAPLHRLLARAAEDEAIVAVTHAAAELAALHALDVDVAGERSIAQELAHTRKRNDRLRIVAPALAAAVDAVLDRVEPLAHAAPAASFSFVHGDYKASQVLIEDGRAVAVDFDRAARGDPALDAGNFLADLHRQAIITGRDGLRALDRAFLDAYGAPAQLAHRARLAQVVVLARMAVRAFRHAPHEYAGSPSTSRSAYLLREAQDCLAALCR